MRDIILFIVICFLTPVFTHNCAHDLNGNGIIVFYFDYYEFTPVISEIHYTPAAL